MRGAFKLSETCNLKNSFLKPFAFMLEKNSLSIKISL